ncbi:LysR substrate-binding domain-containing protein [Arcobacter sp. YIC-464]|uniref:LysR substrate-binding domain-containing protein n=1 Tax=Arcobacter sp. YIC-464 TaxID=3376631 RepID=UPI003C1384C8
MITIKELDIFFKLCEDSHISNLAKQINMTQAAISSSLNSLEKKLDEKLFDRVGKRLVLNERGRLFKEYSYSPYLELLYSTELFNNEKLKGNLKIASSKTFNCIDLSLYVYDFISKHNVQITKLSSNTKQIIQSIVDSSIDIGFIENEFNDPHIIKEKLSNDELIVVTANESLKEKDYFIDELYEMNWILREKGSATREIFLNKIPDASNINIAMEISNFDEIIKILLHDKNSITCISKLAIQKEIEEGKLFELEMKNIDFKRELFMIYHRDKYKSKLFLEFSSYIKECFYKNFDH